MELSIFTVNDLPGRQEPIRKRQCFLDDGTGEIYVPASMFAAGEDTALLLACCLNITFVKGHGHAYLPLSFARTADPEGIELWNLIARRVAQALKIDQQ